MLRLLLMKVGRLRFHYDGLGMPLISIYFFPHVSEYGGLHGFNKILRSNVPRVMGN